VRIKGKRYQKDQRDFKVFHDSSFIRNQNYGANFNEFARLREQDEPLIQTCVKPSRKIRTE
jgi:hypothetical protein